jgi:DNA ligase (NAD+)
MEGTAAKKGKPLRAPPLQPHSASPKGSTSKTLTKPSLPPSIKKSTVKKALKIKKKLTIKAKTPSPVKATVKMKTPSPLKTKKTTLKKTKLVIKKRIKPIPEVKETEMPVIAPSLQPSLQPQPQRGGPGGLAPHFIKILEELADIMQRQGEPFKARAYQKAQESIMLYEGEIHTLDQIKDLSGIGKTILSKLDEYMKTGTLRLLERERVNPMNILTKVYGIGPKKAADLIKEGITSINDLRAHPEKLNDVQKVGLNYFEAIETRIPRNEIDHYKKVFETIFQSIMPQGSKMEFVGSYRRGAQESGDIDTLLTNQDNNSSILKTFLDRLIKDKIVIEVLSRGKVKSLTIAQLPGKLPRRVDFLYAPPSEYAFALLYFTGSKAFNTVQRARALKMGYSLNEHGLYYMAKGDKVKGAKVQGDFPDEKSIFDKLEMAYKEPRERVDGRAVVGVPPPEPPIVGKIAATTTPPRNLPPRKTLKIKKSKINSMIPPPPPILQRGGPGGLAPPPMEELPMLMAFKNAGVDALKNLNESELSILIRVGNTAYYCNQKPLMTDNEYDILREHTLARFPNNIAAQEGHTQCLMTDDKSKVKLPYEMWSMDKIKPDTEALSKWQQTYKGPYVLSCKLDGISGLYSTEGSKPKLYTRGNGTIGQDITRFLPYLNLPKEKGITIRGEFIINKATFALKYSKEFANSRNFVAGVINSKTPDPLKCADIDFVSYEVLKPSLKPAEQMQFLLKLLQSAGTESKKKKSAFQVVQHFISPAVSNELLSELLLKWRTEYVYDIDGVICINDAIYPRQTGNPEHAFAFKMVLSDQIAEAKVLEVIWTASKDGYLKPRVHIEPIQLSGVKIEYATGFNARFIEDNKIGMGALIRLTRSGDVIPHIIAVVQPALQAQMPAVPYEWNSTHVDIMLLNKADDQTVKEKNITLFFSSLDVEGLGAGNVKKIMVVGFDTVIKILKMTEADFLLVPGFKQKMATKVRESIKEKVEKVSLAELMHATNIFGRGFGVKKFQLILLKEPTILSDQVLSEEEKVKRITAVEGLARKTAEQFILQLPIFLAFLLEAGLMNKLEEVKAPPHEADTKKQKDTSHPLYGKNIVFTGVRDKDLVEKMVAVGAEQGTAVNKKTFAVVVKELSDETTKTIAARALNIPIMTLSEFKVKYTI